MKKVILLAVLAACLGIGSAIAAFAAGPGTLGDDDPYPLACMNFSGVWRSDTYETLSIEQEGCKWLAIRTKVGPNDQATTIVPDDKARDISGSQWRGQVRHRWNSKTNATTIETHRELVYLDKTVEELVMLERVNPELLLESTYRTTRQSDCGKEACPPHQEYAQRVFRRVE